MSNKLDRQKLLDWLERNRPVFSKEERIIFAYVIDVIKRGIFDAKEKRK